MKTLYLITIMSALGLAGCGGSGIEQSPAASSQASAASSASSSSVVVVSSSSMQTDSSSAISSSISGYSSSTAVSSSSSAMAAIKSGSLGMGLNGISDWSTEYPFIDLMKQARGWHDWDHADDAMQQFSVDEHDWITALKSGQYAGTVFLTPPSVTALPFEKVVVFYDGEGALRYSWSAQKIATESDLGRDVVSVGSGAHLLTITSTNPADPVRNIRIIPEPYLAAYEAGEVFNPVFLEKISQFRALRFMDWMATNSSPTGDWLKRPLAADRTWRGSGGVPLEIMLQLANTIEADPWFNIPHLADENYMTQFATLVRQQLDSALTVYVEHSNEVWNWGFQQAQDANRLGRERWGDVGNAYMQWHGMRTAQVCDAFKLGAFVDQPQRVKCVLGVQTAYHGLQEGALKCPKWVAEGHEACYLHGFDDLGLTTYFNAGLNGPRSSTDGEWANTLRSWMQEEDGGMAKAFAQLNSGTELRHIEGFEIDAGAAAETAEEMLYWSNYASQFGLGLVAYEGGQHITANGGALQNDEDFIQFHIAVNRDTRMEQVYTDVLTAWKNGGGGLHMCFVDIGTPTKYGSWGALEYLTQESSPKWKAITDYNQNVACWWGSCQAVAP